jgi:hypothetical protein
MHSPLHKIYIFKYRPSSHSDDYTLIVTYKSAKAAEKVKETLFKMLEDMQKGANKYDTDWAPDDAHVSTDGNKVWFEVYTAGYLDDVESVLRKVAVPKEEIECYRDYQELAVSVKVPKGLTPETAMLVLDRDEAEAIKWFKQSCGLPKTFECGDGEHQTFEWFYRGDNIYSDGILYIGFEFRVDDCENWKVE